MNLLFDFLPIFLFFITYKFWGIYAAVGIAIAGSVLQVIVCRIKNKRFESMQLITLFSILILGSATLILHNEIFIKWKPTILYWLLGLLFIGSSLIGEKTMIERLMGVNIQLPRHIWRNLNICWSLFFLLLGALNLYVIYHFSTNAWVNFKLFGSLGLTIIFGIIQFIFLAKFINLKAEEKSQ